MAAKNAPGTVIKLRDEQAIFTSAINIRKREIESPGSSINSAGHRLYPVRTMSITVAMLLWIQACRDSCAKF